MSVTPILWLIDIVIMLTSAAGIADLGSLYIPWDAQVAGDGNTRVRVGPSTDYDIKFLLPDKPARAQACIIGVIADWYLVVSDYGVESNSYKGFTQCEIYMQCKETNTEKGKSKTSDQDFCQRGGMSRIDTMEKAPKAQSEPVRILKYVLANPPWRIIISITLFWFWSRLRSCFDPNNFQGTCRFLRSLVTCSNSTQDRIPSGSNSNQQASSQGQS